MKNIITSLIVALFIGGIAVSAVSAADPAPASSGTPAVSMGISSGAFASTVTRSTTAPPGASAARSSAADTTSPPPPGGSRGAPSAAVRGAPERASRPGPC